MPELPEVETIRQGLQRHVVGRIIENVQVSHPRAVRRHVGGSEDLTRRLLGRQIMGAYRRGKYLWLTFSDPDTGPLGEALVVHLGMSGQMILGSPGDRVAEHTRIRVGLDGELDLRFVDQRTFGGWAMNQQRLVSGAVLPESVAHIARDVLDPQLDVPAAVTAIRRKRSDIKRVLLDQTVVSGMGNIYADEALWRAHLHGGRKAHGLSRETITHVLYHARAVMTEALAAGGTSFDALYVNVNGQSGAYGSSLAVYGKAGKPCPRCATPIVRASCGGRSSFSCPGCQPAPTRALGKIG